MNQVGCDTLGLELILSSEIWSPKISRSLRTNGPQTFGTSWTNGSQDIRHPGTNGSLDIWSPWTFGPHGQLVPHTYLFPTDIGYLVYLVLICQWEPDVWEPFVLGD
jgi:hypothetical protein